MQIPVTFYSYFKELTGVERITVDLPEGSKIADLSAIIFRDYPKMETMKRSTLIAVGVEYQDESYELQPGDDVSLFPPVQGGSF